MRLNKNLYDRTVQMYRANFGGSEEAVFAAPGRTEIIGNHTDHQCGRVIASAVDRYMYAAVGRNSSGKIRVCSEGMEPFGIETFSLDPREDEIGTSAALVRGICAYLSGLGVKLGGAGMDIAVASDVPMGSGLSSSACFEVLIAVAIYETLTGEELNRLKAAQAARHAENAYFGKPCGLMDQLACSMGGTLYIDFANDPPAVERLGLNLESMGYKMFLVDSGAGHQNLTDEYAAITEEMRSAARLFGANRLGQAGELLYAIPHIRERLGDRAALRTLHFYEENKRVLRACEALRCGDFTSLLSLVRSSAESSELLLQNVVPVGEVKSQPYAYALAVCRALAGEGGCARVHGGGFGGCVQVYVPERNVHGFLDGLNVLLEGRDCISVEPNARGTCRIM